MKQGQFQQALASYQDALTAYRNANKGNVSEQERVEIHTKLVQVLFILGRKGEAAKYLDDLVSLAKSPAKPALPNTPAPGQIPLSDKLIISAPRKLLDQVGAGKMSFEDFRKAASVEYLQFQAPAGSFSPPRSPEVKPATLKQQ
jgi:tetratricopeptide (TPR) repeat protein